MQGRIHCALQHMAGLTDGVNQEGDFTVVDAGLIGADVAMGSEPGLPPWRPRASTSTKGNMVREGQSVGQAAQFCLVEVARRLLCGVLAVRR